MLRLPLLISNSIIFVSNSKVAMRIFLLLLISCVLVSSCDDGDIITVNLEFEDTFEACGELVFFKTKADPAESLSVKITSAALTLNNFTATTITNNIATLNNPVIERTINGNSNTFNYRTYNTEPADFFCEDVPPSDITIISDQESTTGTAVFSTSLTEDDNDGIPAEDEDINGNGDLTDDDTDGDGIPNYLDADDDGDNVLTIDEDDDLDGDGNPFTNPLNTDGIDEVDYLDTDDDNDGVLTIDEENDLVDQDPTNDRTDPDNPNLPDYLNADISTLINPAAAYREHSISQSFIVNLVLINIQFPTLTQDEFDFGTLTSSPDLGFNPIQTRTVTPDFN